jgi:hypothetical protein
MKCKISIYSLVFMFLSMFIFSFSHALDFQASDSQDIDKIFLPAQENQVFYKDWKLKEKLTFIEAKDIISFKANFGKKVWVGSHSEEDIKAAEHFLGRLENKKNYSMSAVEIGKEVGPFLEDYWKKVDFQGKAQMKEEKKEWAQRFELWGRSFVNLNRMGKQRSFFTLLDYERGNFLLVKPKKGSTMMAWYFPEKYDALIKGLLKYETQIERSKK